MAISGVYVANVTPFREDGSIDREAYLAHVNWLVERGVQGIVPFGTNGEGPSVTLGEKREVLEALSPRPPRARLPHRLPRPRGDRRAEHGGARRVGGGDAARAAG